MEQAGIQGRLSRASAGVVDVRRAVDGNGVGGGFEELYTFYRPLLRRIAMRKFDVPREDAECLVHDVFATYLANSQVHDVHAYLIGGICNASRQYRRRDSKERALFCGTPVCAATPDDDLIDGVVRNLVMKATLKRLGRSCRETLERTLNGETAASIAASRNTTANYIWRLVSFCRNKAKAIYAEMRRR
jgi:hypothetical protein